MGSYYTFTFFILLVKAFFTFGIRNESADLLANSHNKTKNFEFYSKRQLQSFYNIFKSSTNGLVYKGHLDPHLNGKFGHPFDYKLIHVVLKPLNGVFLPVLYLKLKQNLQFLSSTSRIWAYTSKISNIKTKDLSNKIRSCFYSGSVYILNNGFELKWVYNRRYLLTPIGSIVGDLCSNNNLLRGLVKIYGDSWVLEPKNGSDPNDEYLLSKAKEFLQNPKTFREQLLKVVTVNLSRESPINREIHDFITAQNKDMYDERVGKEAASTVNDEINNGKRHFLDEKIIEVARAYHNEGDLLKPINFTAYLRYLNVKHNTTLFSSDTKTEFDASQNAKQELELNRLTFDNLRLGKAGVFCGDNKYQNNQMATQSCSIRRLLWDARKQAFEIKLNVFVDEKMLAYIRANANPVLKNIDTFNIVLFLLRIYQKELTKDASDVAYLLEKANLFVKQLSMIPKANTFSWLTGHDVYTRFYYIRDYNTKAFGFYGNTLCNLTLMGHVVEGSNNIQMIRYIIHEIGHNLNMNHEEDCPNAKCGFMSPFVESQNFEWSDSSVSFLNKLFPK